MSDIIQAFFSLAFIGIVVFTTYKLLDKYEMEIDNFLEYIYLKFFNKAANKIQHIIDIAKQISITDWDRIWKETGNTSCKEIKFDITTSSGKRQFVDFLREHKDDINWHYISQACTLDEKILNEFIDKIDFQSIQMHQKQVPENFLRRWYEEFNLLNVLHNQKLSEEFIREHVDQYKKVHWANICAHQKLSESFIREFKDKVNWTQVILNQDVSLDFVMEHKKKVNWVEVSMERLTEEQIDKYKELLEWVYICGMNNIRISDKFIKEHEKYIIWSELRSRHLSKELRLRYGHLIWGGYVNTQEGII